MKASDIKNLKIAKRILNNFKKITLDEVKRAWEYYSLMKERIEWNVPVKFSIGGFVGDSLINLRNSQSNPLCEKINCQECVYNYKKTKKDINNFSEDSACISSGKAGKNARKLVNAESSEIFYECLQERIAILEGLIKNIEEELENV